MSVDSTRQRSGLGTSLARLARVVVTLVLVAEGLLLVVVGGSDVFAAARSPETWVSGLAWLVGGAFALYLAARLPLPGQARHSPMDQQAGAWAVRRLWWIATVQVAAFTLLYYAFWVEATSHIDRWSTLLAWGMAVPAVVGVAVAWVGYRARGAGQSRSSGEERREADGSAPRAEWKAQALVALLGVLGSAAVVVVEKVYLPSHDVPTVNITATMEQLGRDGDQVFLRGTITLTNDGAAPASVLGSLYRVTGHRFAEPSPTDTSGQRAAIDGSAVDSHRFPQPDDDVTGARLLQADDVAAISAFLLPGEVISRSFALRASAAKEDYARLDAEVIVMTGRVDGDASKRCTRQADRRPDSNPTNYESVCWETRLPPRNTIHSLLDDDLRVQSVVVISDPNATVPLPSLSSMFVAGDSDELDLPADFWLSNFISEISTRTEYAFTAAVGPGTAGSGASGSSGPIGSGSAGSAPRG